MSTTTTAATASPMLRRNVLGKTSSPARLTATVSPENSTVRPAAATVRCTASTTSGMCRRSSRKRTSISRA